MLTNSTIAINDSEPLDHFIEKKIKFAGLHLLADFWGATNLDNLQLVTAAMKQAAKDANSTLLQLKLQHFTPNFGVSGVAILAESHISIHTWPEKDYAAIDVFMCGDSKPYEAIKALKNFLLPQEIDIKEIMRGRGKIKL